MMISSGNPAYIPVVETGGVSQIMQYGITSH